MHGAWVLIDFTVVQPCPLTIFFLNLFIYSAIEAILTDHVGKFFLASRGSLYMYLI